MTLCTLCFQPAQFILSTKLDCRVCRNFKDTSFYMILKKCILNPVKHQRCSFLKAECFELFSQKSPSQMSNRVLNTPLILLDHPQKTVDSVKDKFYLVFLKSDLINFVKAKVKNNGGGVWKMFVTLFLLFQQVAKKSRMQILRDVLERLFSSNTDKF